MAQRNARKRLNKNTNHTSRINFTTGYVLKSQARHWDQVFNPGIKWKTPYIPYKKHNNKSCQQHCKRQIYMSPRKNVSKLDKHSSKNHHRIIHRPRRRWVGRRCCSWRRLEVHHHTSQRKGDEIMSTIRSFERPQTICSEPTP